MRRGHERKDLNIGIGRDRKKSDLKVGPYIFIQTIHNKNEYHAPGMKTVTKSWITDFAKKKKWSVISVARERKIG